MKNKFLATSFAFTLLSCSAFAAGPFTLDKVVITPQVHSALQHIALEEGEITKAKSFVDSLAGDAIGFLSDQNLSHEQRTDKFSALLEKRFDLKSIGRFAMGRYWRQMSDAQKDEYTDLFQAMVIEVYSRRFSEYQGQEIHVQSARAEGSRDALVSSLIKDNAGGPDIRLDWRLRYKNGQYRVIDIIVEGVSMALTQRAEFASIIQRGGGEVQVLLAHLEGQE